jgi:hypothetical protein
MKGRLSSARSVAMILRHRLAGLALLTPLLISCVVPYPIPEWTYKEVPDSIVRGIQPGTTSRADILLRLSEPWIRGAGDGYFVYSWLESLGGLGVALNPGVPIPFVAGTQMRCHCLVIQFGDDGRVERVTTLDATGTAWQDMYAFPCPGEQMKEAIQQWLAQSPARP